MSREIKFRAWDKMKGIMSEVVELGGEEWNDGVSTKNYMGSWDRFEVMQYTGLKDKNGKEIYEGDICRVLYTDWPSKPERDTRSLEQYLTDISRVKVVHWDFNGFYFSEYVGGYSTDMEVGTHGRIEIIGNIYENPELLSSTNK